MTRLYWENSESIDYIEEALRANRVICGSSDTVLGLLVDLTHKGVRSLDAIKKRFGKPYLVLVASKNAAMAFIEQDQALQVDKLMSVCWPGPVTLILRAKEEVPGYMKSAAGTIALRVPDHVGLQRLLQRFEGLFSTSANITGEPVPIAVDELDERISGHIALFVSDRVENRGKNKVLPSTILDCSGSQIRAIRRGAYPIEVLEELCGKGFK